MGTNNNNNETAAVAPESPQDEYEYFNMVAKKYLPLPELDEQEYRRRWDNNDHPATEPKLPPDEEAEYFLRIREFRQRRREAGLKIDPETAEMYRDFREAYDPYHIDPLLPREAKDCYLKTWFVRSPGNDIWVYFEDLPSATKDTLDKRGNVSSRLTAEEAITLKNEEPFDDEMPF